MWFLLGFLSPTRFAFLAMILKTNLHLEKFLALAQRLLLILLFQLVRPPLPLLLRHWVPLVQVQVQEQEQVQVQVRTQLQPQPQDLAQQLATRHG